MIVKRSKRGPSCTQIPLMPSPDNELLPGSGAPPTKLKRSGNGKAHKRPRVKERDIQAACITWLKLQGWRVIRHHPVQPIGGKFVKLRGEDIGFPDLIAVHQLSVLFIEMKASDGEMSAEQIKMHNDPRMRPWCVCIRSLEDLIEVFNSRNLEFFLPGVHLNS